MFRTSLEPVGSSPGWYQVPEQDTPEQYGANIIKLTPVDRVAGQPHTITVNLDGYVNPGQTRRHLRDARGDQRLGRRGAGAFQPDLAKRRNDLRTRRGRNRRLSHRDGDSRRSIAITSGRIRFIPVGGITQKIERFPYRVAMSGAVPVRSETPVDRPAPGGSAVRHTNPDGSIGGWKTVSVPASVYLGPNVWVTGGSVSGNARIEDYATIVGGTVNGNAIVRGNARVQAGTVTGNAIVEDYAVIAGGTISEFAHVRGDARINAGQIRGNALVLDYATIMNNSTVVAGDTVIKGYGVVDNAQHDRQRDGHVVRPGGWHRPRDQHGRAVQRRTCVAGNCRLMTTQYNNLFARYLFATQDNNVVWENFNTTYGWMSETPPTWLSSSGIVGL